MDIEDDEILQGFIEESLEHLADIENDLLAIEEGGANIDEDLVNKVFRAAHSIKGGAGFMGLTTIQELSHAAENVLGMIRSKKLIPTPEIINVLLIASDQLQSMIEDVHHSNEVDISAHLLPLNSIADGTFSLATQAPPPKTSKSRAKDEKIKLDTPESPSPVKDAPPAEQAKPAAAVQTQPEPEPVSEPEDELDHESAYLSLASPEDDNGYDIGDSGNDSDMNTEVKLAGKIESGSDRSKSTTPPAKAETTLRVHVSLLDSLMNLAGELVLSRNQLLQTIGSDDLRNAEAVGQRIDLITSELQEAIMLTRMQPIGNVFSKFPRVVRDLAKKLNKTIDLTIVGKDVELDKTIIEAINDPLTHLVRNSVDHGIEKPADRKKTW